MRRPIEISPNSSCSPPEGLQEDACTRPRDVARPCALPMLKLLALFLQQCRLSLRNRLFLLDVQMCSCQSLRLFLRSAKIHRGHRPQLCFAFVIWSAPQRAVTHPVSKPVGPRVWTQRKADRRVTLGIIWTFQGPLGLQQKLSMRSSVPSLLQRLNLQAVLEELGVRSVPLWLPCYIVGVD